MRFLNSSAAVVIGCLVLALLFLAPPPTHGDEWNLATRFSLNHPFEVPGVVLQPNTNYVIRLLDLPSTRNVVQILNEDQTKLLTQFIAISDQRNEPTDDTVFTFIEVAPQFPMPIKEWFYPGRLHGLEFVYPKKQAAEIAAHMRTSEVQTATITKQETTTVVPEQPAVVAEAPPPPSIEEKQPEVVEQPPVEQPAQVAQVEQPPAPAPVQETRELPRTAGELPLIALLGVLFLGVGVGMKVLSARQ